MALLSIAAFTILLAFVLWKSFQMFPSWLQATLPFKDREPAARTSPSGQRVGKGQDSSDHERVESMNDDQNGEETPKARATEMAENIPTLTLRSEGKFDDHPVVREEVKPRMPAARNVQDALKMPPPPRPSSLLQVVPGPSLMPPPAHPADVLRQNGNASLRVPSSGPLPNRGPPANSQQRVSTALQADGAIATPNSRGKVLLSPGHSPMDWAALTRSSRLSGVDTFQRVMPSELRKMTGRKGKPAWSSWQNKVYNITPYLPFHPGGEAELMKAAGRDGTKLFMDVHPWVNWDNMLESCLVGIMVPEGYGNGEGSALEDMD